MFPSLLPAFNLPRIMIHPVIVLASSAGSSRGFGGHQSDSSEEDDQQSGDGGLATITEEAASAADAAPFVAHLESHQQTGSLTPTTDGSAEDSQGTKGEAQAEGGWLGYIKRLNPWKPKDETVGQEEVIATEQAKSAEEDFGEEKPAATEQTKASWWSWLPWAGSSTDDASIEDIKSEAPFKAAALYFLILQAQLTG